MNIYRTPEGILTSYVQVYRSRDPELHRVIDRSPAAIAARPDLRYGVTDIGRWELPRPGKVYPDYVQGGTMTLYTRIWLGVAPPKGADPGYCAVLGEVFDGQYRAKQRALYLLDEACCLEGDPGSAILPDFFAAIAAAKDIYLANHLYLPPQSEQFLIDLQRPQWGITGYEDLQEDELRRDFPFFRHLGVIASPLLAPYGDDEEYGRRHVDALLQRGLLRHHEICTVFKSRAYQTPHRALALVALAMQAWNWNTVIGEREPKDGYPLPKIEEEEEEAEQAQEALESHMARLLALSVPGIRPHLEKLQDKFRDDPGRALEEMEKALRQ